MRGEKNPYEILEGAAKVLSAEHEKLKKEKKKKKEHSLFVSSTESRVHASGQTDGVTC